MRTQGRLFVLIVLACLLFAPLTCAALEPYVGAFIGAAIPQDSDIEQVFGSKFRDVSFDTSFLFGGKAGLFFDPSILGGNLGLEMEVYHFQPDVGAQVVQATFPGFTGPGTVGSKDIHVTVVGLNALYRFRFAEDPRFPRGRFQPYLGVGVGAFIANLKTSISFLDAPQTVSDTDVKPGFQATVGTRFFLTPYLALFTEYKYTHTADFNFNLISGPGTVAGAPTFGVNNFKFDLTTHLLAVGLGYHW